MQRRQALFCMGWLGTACLSRSWAAAPITHSAEAVLLVVDVQSCFVDGGTLPVQGGAEVVPVINRLAKRFDHVVLTQDWHPPGHVSFASAHPGKQPFDTTQLSYGTQVLWPDHCLQGSNDAQLHPGLDVPQAELILRKGFHADVDSYSAFLEADGQTATGLSGYLRQRGLTSVFVVGLATDFCVAATAIDASSQGFTTYVIEDACRAVNINGSLDAAWQRMDASGVRRIRSQDV